MAPRRTPVGLLWGIAGLLLLVASGCEWWVWKGDSDEEVAANESADETADEETTTSGGDLSTDGAEADVDSSGLTEDGGEASGEDGEPVTCTEDADCDEGQTCQDGVCVSEEADAPAAEDLSGLAVDAESGEEIDFAVPLTVGDTLTLEAPDPTVASTRLPGEDCTCVWTVDPATAGVFTAATECSTDFTVAQAGALLIAVEVTCAGTVTTFRQGATAEEGDAPPACTSDEDCPADQTCQDGTCTATAEEPCTADEDCAAGESCLGGVCVGAAAGECTTDEDCSDGEVCEEGLCTTAPAADPSMALFELQTRVPYVVRFDLWLKDGDGRAVPEGVTAEHFRIYEDEVRIELTETNQFVTAAPSLPLRIVLVLDYTASMDSVDAIGLMVNAAEEFVQSEHFTATHSIGVVEFHDRTDQGEGYSIAVPLTTADLAGKEVIVRGIPAEGTLESGLTRVWDALALAMEMLVEEERQAGEARVVAFLTDGRDTTSEELPESVSASAQEKGINLYPIGFGNVGEGETTLRSLADDTNGAYFPAADADGLQAAFAEVAQALQGHWNLTYVTPTNSGTVSVRAEFDWDGGTAAIEESFDAAGLAGDVHQGVFEVAERAYDAVLNRTEFVLQAAYMPRNVSRFRFLFADVSAIFNLQNAGGLTAPEAGWSLTPMGDGVYDLLGPKALEYGSFGNIAVASVSGDVPVLQITHYDAVYTGMAQPKTMLFEDDLWALPYELTVVVEPTGTGTVVIDPDKTGYAHGELVTLTAVDGTKPFAGWSGDLESTVATVNLLMDADKLITATFAEPAA